MMHPCSARKALILRIRGRSWENRKVLSLCLLRMHSVCFSRICFRVVAKAIETKDVVLAKRKTRWHRDKNWPISKLWNSKPDRVKIEWSWRSSMSPSRPTAWSLKIDERGAVRNPRPRKRLTFSKSWRLRSKISFVRTSLNVKLPNPNLQKNPPRLPKAPPEDPATKVVAPHPIITPPWESLIKTKIRLWRQNLQRKP